VNWESLDAKQDGTSEGFTMQLSCEHAAIHIVNDVATCTDCGQTTRMHRQTGRRRGLAFWWNVYVHLRGRPRPVDVRSTDKDSLPHFGADKSGQIGDDKSGTYGRFR